MEGTLLGCLEDLICVCSLSFKLLLFHLYIAEFGAGWQLCQEHRPICLPAKERIKTCFSSVHSRRLGKSPNNQAANKAIFSSFPGSHK